MLDLACSHHYTSHQEWFATYQKIDGGSVNLGDDHSCKVAGVGTVRVRMYDGIIHTLSNVKYVPRYQQPYHSDETVLLFLSSSLGRILVSI